MNTISVLMQYLIYPVTLSGVTFLSYWMMMREESSLLSSAIPLVTAYLIIILGEKFMPFQEKWKYPKKEFFLNFIHVIINSRVMVPLAKVSFISAYSYTHGLNFFERFLIWPQQLPLVVQLIIAVLITDFIIYWFHRWMHYSDLGWKIHVIHHTTKHMNVFASSRSHPFNAILVFLFEFGALSLLGASEMVLVMWTVFMSANGLFEHCNINLKFSFLNRIMATAEVHRIHHHPTWEKSNSNFGNITCLWDQLFGTYFPVKEDCVSQGLSLFSIPENYWDHLKTPFILDKYRKKNS